MAEVICPECRRFLPIPQMAKAGDLLSCPFCAGLSLRLSKNGGASWTASVLKKASCAVCGEEVILPDEARPGDVIEHCGQRQEVSFEYDSYALEPI